MEDKQQSIQIATRLTEADFISFTTTAIADNLYAIPPYDSYEFLTDITYTVVKDKKTISANIKIRILNKDSKAELGTILTKFSMVVENFDEAVTRVVEGKTEFLPFAFMIISSTGISTTRGMLIMAASNTKISNALLPFMDSSKFIPNNENSVISNIAV